MNVHMLPLRLRAAASSFAGKSYTSISQKTLHLKYCGSINNASQQRRHLHATWSILLNHHWLYVKSPAKNVIVPNKIQFEETDLPCENIPTMLFLHDARADLQQCRPLAEHIITASTTLTGHQKPVLQCLLVDLR